MRTTKESVALCCVGICAVVASADQAIKRTAVQGPPADKRWNLVWNEEFEGSAIDMHRWQYVSLEQEGEWHYPGLTTRHAAENCMLDGQGNLVLSLTRDSDGTLRFNKGLQSRTFEQAFGYFETRIQFSTQPGWWSAVWLSGVPYNEGVDTFQSPQEFDIFEDFNKVKDPKAISHFYHATVGLDPVKGIGGTNMLARAQIGLRSKGTAVQMEEYGGWHTVALAWSPLEHIFYVDGRETFRQSYKEVPITTVPQRVWISSCLKTPKILKKDGGPPPFYGFLEDATFPDKLVVDYVRVYEEDLGNKTPPTVTVTLDGNPEELYVNRPVTFHVHAHDLDGIVKKVYLFSSGYIRAEAEAIAPLPASWLSRLATLFGNRSHAVDQTFIVTNLFETCNTIIAMAQDDDGLVGMSAPLQVNMLTGREYAGTAYQGTPQAIPGTLIAGHYDEGGNGVAFKDNPRKGDPRATAWRITEIANASDESTIPATAQWVTYCIHVNAAGAYDLELLMNRPDYGRKGEDFSHAPDDVIQLDVDKVKVAEWTLPAAWVSGHSFRKPLKPVGKQRVTLTAGEHRLIVRFDRVKTRHTFFGGFVVTGANTIH